MPTQQDMAELAPMTNWDRMAADYSILGLSPEADLDARFKHFIFGALNCQEWAVFQRVHDGDHERQIEQIKAAPGFPSA